MTCGKGHRPSGSRHFEFRCQRNGANGLAVASRLAPSSEQANFSSADIVSLIGRSLILHRRNAHQLFSCVRQEQLSCFRIGFIHQETPAITKTLGKTSLSTPLEAPIQEANFRIFHPWCAEISSEYDLLARYLPLTNAGPQTTARILN